MIHETSLRHSKNRLNRLTSMFGRLKPALYGVGIAVVLAGCASNAPQDTFAPKGPNAQKIDTLQKPVFAVAGIIGVIVFAAVVYAVIKFRDRGQPIPHQTHGNPALEITLTIIPALILAVVGVFTFRTVFDLSKTDDTEMIINVTGQQWWWEYDYPVQNEYGITQPIITSGQWGCSTPRVWSRARRACR